MFFRPRIPAINLGIEFAALDQAALENSAKPVWNVCLLFDELASDLVHFFHGGVQIAKDP
jgi:hypothetical protein